MLDIIKPHFTNNKLIHTEPGNPLSINNKDFWYINGIKTTEEDVNAYHELLDCDKKHILVMYLCKQPEYFSETLKLVKQKLNKFSTEY